MAIGTLDTEADWLATALLLEACGSVQPPPDDAAAFLTGHKIGFLTGYIAAMRAPQPQTALMAYAALLKRHTRSERE